MIARSRLPMIPAHPQFARAVPAPLDAAAALRDHGRAGVRHGGHGTGRRRLRRCRAGRTCKTDRSRDGDRSQNCAQDVSPCDAIFAPGRSRRHARILNGFGQDGGRVVKPARRVRLKIQRGERRKEGALPQCRIASGSGALLPGVGRVCQQRIHCPAPGVRSVPRCNTHQRGRQLRRPMSVHMWY